MSSPEACARVAAQLAGRGLRLRTHPMADGGEGTLDAIAAHRPLQTRAVLARGPYGDLIPARVGRLGDVSILESAEAIGLAKACGRRDPLRATSAGLGRLLEAATAEDGPILVGLGGSATVDGGLGALGALGLEALDAQGRRLGPDAVAGDLHRLSRLVGPPPLQDRVVRVLCDVRTRQADAPARFGPQKGLAAADLSSIEGGFARLRDALAAWRDAAALGPIDPDIAGGGAAGGLGLALAAVLDAPLVPGAATMARLTGLEAAMEGVWCVVVGEGRLDPTSFEGKVAEVVTRAARAQGAAVIGLVGQVADAPPAPVGPDVLFVAGEEPDRETGWRQAVVRLGEWLSKRGSP